MTFDSPHMIVTGAIIFAVVYGANHMPHFESMPKRQKSLVTFAVLFVALFVPNLVWPFASGAWEGEYHG